MDNPAASVVGEDEVIGRILVRVRRGEKVWPLAQLYGVPPRSVYEAADVEGIVLKRGRLPITPHLYRQHFDKKHGPGAAARFLGMWNQSVAYRPLGEKFGLSGEGARYAGKWLANGVPKKHPAPKARRTDLTPEKIRWAAEHSTSTAEVCKLLGANYEVVRSRAGKYAIDLPKGRSGIGAGFLRRPDITPERVRWHARRAKSVGELAAKFHCAVMTILSRAKEHGIKLPFDFWKARQEAVYKCISVLAKLGFQVPEITKVLRIGAGVAYDHGRSPETKRGNRIAWAGWELKRRRGVEACARLLAEQGWSARETAEVVITSRRTTARIRSSRKPAE